MASGDLRRAHERPIAAAPARASRLCVGSVLVRALVAVLLALLLSSCLLISGEERALDTQGDSGNLSTIFVSAEGSEERSFVASTGASEVQVIAIVAVETGDLQLDIIAADSAVVFTIASHPDSPVTRSGMVRTDARGQLRYRVSARNARNGSFQIFFQP